MTYVGIDPGKKGAIVRIGRKVTKWAIPLDGKDVDLDELCRIISNLNKKSVVCLESVHSIYGTGKQSMFTMGRVFGNIESALKCNGIKFHYVRPTDWQARVWKDKIKIKSGKKLVTDTKATSLRTAQALYPKLDLRYGKNETIHKGRERSTPHDGIVDALLIAHYAKHYVK